MARVESRVLRGVGAAGGFKRVLRAATCAALTALASSEVVASPDVPAAPGPLADHAACRIVRLSDIGWTDVTATTALFAALIRHLGYRPEITVLSLPVTYASMKNKDIDVFRGNWMPSQGGASKSYVADKSVEVIRANLTGAKYTLAAPAYTYEAGLRSFADIERYAGQLHNSIYGIEPGNDGNRLVLGMLRQNLFGLGNFKLVESSEQGMLAEVERAFRAHAPIVFLAWDPHPMNMRFDLRYLSGGDAVFGPNYGEARVDTNTRAGYSAQCPNIGRLLRNLSFTTQEESRVMADILDRHQPPEVAAESWLKANPTVVAGWLEGVTTFDGRPALSAMSGAGKLRVGFSLELWVSDHKIPVGDSVALVIAAALVSTAIGVPVGIAAAHRPRLYAALRPVLDLMQTLPTFVYLIPTLVLFGLGVVPGLISTVIFALPAPIRLTQLGVSSVPTALLEAGQAFGATPRQLLWKVELPSAAPTILAGITQCIMLSLSMVVIAALVGAGGLGVPVVRALSTVQVGMGFEAGFVIVLLAIVLDRISRPADKAPGP